jgi:hypothetical protein
MKFDLRKIVNATAVSALLFGAGLAGAGAIMPAEAAPGIRTVVTVCDWENLDWNEMSSAEKRQWATLGWNQTLWESDDDTAYPASAFKDWEELNLNERAAAWTLGYTPRSWDDDVCP